jgi:hypothetical protein
MKKQVFLIFGLILLISLALISSTTSSERKQIAECKKDCRLLRFLDKADCESSFKECRTLCFSTECKRECSLEKRDCIIQSNKDYNSCKSLCINNQIDFSINESVCQNSGGLYQEICNGPYFDIVCSQQKFCICGGNFNYTCPVDYLCVMKFASPNKRLPTIDGWKTLIGVKLGNIGLCGKGAE